MDADFLNAVAGLQVKLADHEEDVDVLLDELRPRKRKRITSDAIGRDLEDQYLKPSTSFGTAWLNKFQEWV